MSLRQSHSPSQKVGPVRVSKPATSNAYHPYSPIRLKSRFFPDPSTTALKNSAAKQSEPVVQGPTIGSTNEAPITQHVDRPAMISNQPSGLKVVTRSKYWEEPLRSDVNKQKQRREYTPTHSIAEEKGKVSVPEPLQAQMLTRHSDRSSILSRPCIIQTRAFRSILTFHHSSKHTTTNPSTIPHK